MLKISLLRAATPSEADVLQRQAYNVLPCVRITDLLLEVDAAPTSPFKANSGHSDACPPCSPYSSLNVLV